MNLLKRIYVNGTDTGCSTFYFNNMNGRGMGYETVGVIECRIITLKLNLLCQSFNYLWYFSASNFVTMSVEISGGK